MKKAVLFFVALAVWGFTFQALVHGHGGQYPGPGDNVPPNQRGPGDVSGPSRPATPGILGPAGGTTIGGPGGSLTQGPPGRTGIGLGGGMTRRHRGAGEGYERWEFWWENNKDAFLNLKDHLRTMTNTYGSSTWLTGQGRKGTVVTSNQPTPSDIRKEIHPSLMAVLDVDDADILDSAVLALARSTRSEDAGSIMNPIREMLKSRHESVQQSATLALGVLGAEEACALLNDLMIDSREGRKSVGRHEVPPLVRSHAALSLGLINSPDGVDPLIRVVKRADQGDRDIKVCAIIALGLMKNNMRQAEIVQFLIRLLDDRKQNAFVKAALPIALAKLGDPLALSPICSAFRKEKSSHWVTQSCAIALGRLATPGNEEAVDLLMKYIDKGKDLQTRNFAIIALGQIGANAKGDEVDKNMHRKIHHFLMKQVTRPSRTTNRPFAALAAAINARSHEAYQDGAIDKLSFVFSDLRDPSHKGAVAVALGLLGAQGEAASLYKDLKKSREDSLKGYLCLALGMIGHAPAKEAIREATLKKAATQYLRLQAATALGLMRDPGAVEILIQAMKESRTLSEICSTVKALGMIGDRSAIEPLKTLLLDEGESPQARAFSAVALGIMGEKTDLPWNVVIKENFNYRAKVAAISEVFDIL